MHNRYTSRPQPLFAAQNGIALQLRGTAASQTAALASLQTNGLKGATVTKSDDVLCVK